MTSPAHIPSELPRSLALVGAGKMGGSLLEGWLATGLEASRVAVIDPAPSLALQRSAAEHGYRLSADANDVAAPEVLVLATKPQLLPEVAPKLRHLVSPDTLLLSVMAGKSTADLTRALPGTDAIVRAMPNLPASIRRGATGAFATAGTSAGQRAAAHALLAGVGLVEWVADEGLIDAVTAVSGSGPAYLFLLTECLAQAGCAAGLHADLSARLARATIAGAGALMGASAEEPSRLRENVTSPGGTTAAALSVLMGPNGLAPLMTEAVEAARRRAAELSG